MRQQEHNEQASFFRWCELNLAQHPGLDRFWAVPNGGHRSKAVAGKLKAEGVRRGIPDVINLTASDGHVEGCADCAADGRPFKGLIFEFKSETGSLTTEQRDWKRHFEEQGFRFEVPRSWVEAVLITIDYFGLPEELKKDPAPAPDGKARGGSSRANAARPRGAVARVRF